ncbi:helix-turn-helix domain-containing protein [Spirillospora sp. NPDC047279]|uniref:TetR/AcrR family transcriptional regulator n=1 Tax=Spirillospora sp. NPDC047279 TaxID=3155478 RepID=UPI0033EAF7B0
MARLTRAETQERNRAKVLVAARDEFAERGFRDAKIDNIADRAGLTRGAVYSNFPGKRALYFAVLAALAETIPPKHPAGDTPPDHNATDPWARPEHDSAPSTRHAVAPVPPAANEQGTTKLGQPQSAASHAQQGTASPGHPEGAAPPAQHERGAVGSARHAGGPARLEHDANATVREGRDAREALAAFARAWVAGLPLSAADDGAGLGIDLMPEIAAEERLRLPFAQLMKLNALLLGTALEHLARSPERRVKIAETVLTTLQGVSQLAAAAPGFVDPFDIVHACARLADLDLTGGWPPPHTPYIAPARPVDEPWSAPSAVDAVRGEPARLTGVVAVLGLHRLEAAEEALRAAPPEAEVTAVLVTGDPDEEGPLARLAVAGVLNCLREAFPPAAWPRLRIVHDEKGAVAAAAGVPAVSDATEAALRVESGRVIARADGRGACHAAASFADIRRSPRLHG